MKKQKKNTCIRIRISKEDKLLMEQHAAKNIYTAGLAEIQACGHESPDIESDFDIKICDRSKKIDLLTNDSKISLVFT